MDLEEFFEHFATVYTKLDVDGVCNLFAMPFFTLINEERTDWPEMETLRDTTQALFTWYAAQGFHDATYTVLSLMQINHDLASAQLRWRVIRNDGTPWEYQTSYHLKRIEQTWKIAGVIQFENGAAAQKIHFYDPERRKQQALLLDVDRRKQQSPLLVQAEDALRDIIHRPTQHS
ncbi:hypothetical protein [uncultured Deefgea sp.]|uniref:hypothetical protein n=1 Tax=uncultured Deefgea sp. TaxID=1304914 RepID=UPI002592A2D5|nr:hypothetical protein [uncultured Deefgea sp.]